MVKASERRPVRSAMSTFRRRPRSPKMSFKVAETLFDLHAFPIQAPHRLDRWKRLTVGGDSNHQDSWNCASGYNSTFTGKRFQAKNQGNPKGGFYRRILS